jgi:uncharacterized protein YqgC (DUF456 family)
MTAVLWLVASLLMLVGLVGTVLPALPGVPLIFAGVLLAAWIDDFQRIGGWTVTVIGALAAVGVVIDYVAAAATARRAGASAPGIVGAALGTIAGVFSGLWGLVFMPLLGAAIGEFVAQRDVLRAGKVGLATWLGLLLGTVAKIAIAFTMVGLFVVALLF